MDSLKILNKNEKQEILNKLQEQFGIKDIPGILLKKGEERIYLFTGSFQESEIKRLESLTPIERAGIYFGKQENNQIRLSIEGVHILQEQINKNTFELDNEQAEQWMMGQELNIQTGKKGFIVMKFKDNFLGCGKASEQKISNFIPKNRRLKSKY